jgi:hypothetical protein
MTKQVRESQWTFHFLVLLLIRTDEKRLWRAAPVLVQGFLSEFEAAHDVMQYGALLKVIAISTSTHDIHYLVPTVIGSVLHLTALYSQVLY